MNNEWEPDKWMYISTPNYTIAVGYYNKGGLIIKVPPIARWMYLKRIAPTIVCLRAMYGNKVIFKRIREMKSIDKLKEEIKLFNAHCETMSDIHALACQQVAEFQMSCDRMDTILNEVVKENLERWQEEKRNAKV